MSCHSIPIYLANANPIVMIVEDKSEIDLRHPRDKKISHQMNKWRYIFGHDVIQQSLSGQKLRTCNYQYCTPSKLSALSLGRRIQE